MLVVVLFAIAWSERTPEWVNYQRAFFDMAQVRAQNSAQMDWYAVQRVEIRQISVVPLKRVDRCTTCHLAITDPNFMDAPEPFRTHSTIIASHPPESFGCTVCHRGEGRAVTTLAAHGLTPGSSARMLRGAYLASACAACHNETSLPPEDTREIVAGVQAINQLRCLRCHQLGSMGESEGPDLSAVGSRRDAIELYAHLLNPPAMTLGSTMPIFSLAQPQIQAITIYLLTAQGTAQMVNDVHYLVRNSGDTNDGHSTESYIRSSDRPYDEPILFFGYEGQQLYWGAGCGVCHAVGGEGGTVGPALTHIGRVRDRDWLSRYLRDPSAVRPDSRMPQLYLNDREIDALVEYMLRLK